jgi:hypothetical protein
MGGQDLVSVENAFSLFKSLLDIIGSREDAGDEWNCGGEQHAYNRIA